MLLDVSNTDLLSCCSVAPTALERRGGKSKYPAEIVLKPSGHAGGVSGVGVLCACTRVGEDQWDVAVVSPRPDPAAVMVQCDSDSGLGGACPVGQSAVPSVRDFLGKPGVRVIKRQLRALHWCRRSGGDGL